jgi:hypothetical protein
MARAQLPTQLTGTSYMGTVPSGPLTMPLNTQISNPVTVAADTQWLLTYGSDQSLVHVLRPGYVRFRCQYQNVRDLVIRE